MSKLQKEADKVYRNWPLEYKSKLIYLREHFPDKGLDELEAALEKAEDDFLYNNTLYYQPPRS